MYRTVVLSFLLSIAVLSPLSAESYGPVKRGEYLSIIAQKTRSDMSLSLAQVMVAIYLKNPDAFIGGSINLLSEGSELTLPTVEEIRSIPVQLAKAEVRRQNKAWDKLGFDLATIPLSKPKLTLSHSPVDEEKADTVESVAAISSVDSGDSASVVADMTQSIPDVAVVEDAVEPEAVVEQVVSDLESPALEGVSDQRPVVVDEEVDQSSLTSQPAPVEPEQSPVKQTVEKVPAIVDQPVAKSEVEEPLPGTAVSPLDMKSIGLYLLIALFVVMAIYLLFFRKPSAVPNIPEQQEPEPEAFDFSEDPGPTINPAQIEAQMAAITLSQNLTTSDRKFFDVGVAKIEGYDEIPLKLDLAKAYVDLMNFTEGSRLLDEVMLSGTDEQKKEARDLMEWVSLIMREDAQVSS